MPLMRPDISRDEALLQPLRIATRRKYPIRAANASGDGGRYTCLGSRTPLSRLREGAPRDICQVLPFLRSVTHRRRRALSGHSSGSRSAVNSVSGQRDAKRRTALAPGSWGGRSDRSSSGREIRLVEASSVHASGTRQHASAEPACAPCTSSAPTNDGPFGIAWLSAEFGTTCGPQHLPFGGLGSALPIRWNS